MRKALLAAALATLTTPAMAGELWNVMEGPQGLTAGVWNIERTAGGFTGSATMRGGDGRPVIYTVVGTIDGPAFTAKRQAPSDGQICTYSGTLEPPKADRKGFEVKGSASCRQGSGIWRVLEAKPAR